MTTTTIIQWTLVIIAQWRFITAARTIRFTEKRFHEWVQSNETSNIIYPSQTCVTFTHWWMVVDGQTIWFSGQVKDAASIERCKFKVKHWSKIEQILTATFVIFIRRIFTIILRKEKTMQWIISSRMRFLHHGHTPRRLEYNFPMWHNGIPSMYNFVHLQSIHFDSWTIDSKNTHHNWVVHQIHQHNLNAFNRMIFPSNCILILPRWPSHRQFYVKQKKDLTFSL